jgi:hypothetical protein
VLPPAAMLVLDGGEVALRVSAGGRVPADDLPLRRVGKEHAHRAGHVADRPRGDRGVVSLRGVIPERDEPVEEGDLAFVVRGEILRR